MKSLKQLQAAEAKRAKEIRLLEKKLENLRKRKPHNRYPFRCRKCGLAFKHSEVGYKDWEVVVVHQDCMPMGEYDIREDFERQSLACCPKCGHNFGIQVCYPNWIRSTKTYGRWEDRPDFVEPYEKCLDKKIRKVTPEMVKYMKENW